MSEMAQDAAHKVYAKCRVLFLGPEKVDLQERGLMALEKPLNKCYPLPSREKLEGIDAYLTIYSSGLQLQLLDRKPLLFWFPIQHLYVAAAMKCVVYLDPRSGEVIETKFLEVSEEDSKLSSHPPLFSFISWPAAASPEAQLQCYTFVARNDQSAMMMVEAARYAYNNQSGWSNHIPPQEIYEQEIVMDESDSASDGSDASQPRVINVDHLEGEADKLAFAQSGESKNEAPSIFPLRLVKKYELEKFQNPAHLPLPNNIQSPGGQLGAPSPQASPLIIQTPPLVVREPPSVIRMPPPPPKLIREKVYIPVHQAPRVQIVRQPYPVHIPVPTPAPPPQIIRPPPQIIEREVPVYIREPPRNPQIRIREVPVPVPSPPKIIREPPEIIRVPVEVPVRSPTPPPKIIREPPQVIEKRVPVFMEPQIIREPVPVPVRSRTPPPKIIRSPPEVIEKPVPVFIREKPQIIREQVPVPVPVRPRTPPTRIIREPPRIVERQVPVIIRKPEVREVPVEVPVQIPVPVPYEVPVQLPVEVPYYYPIPMPLKPAKGNKSRRSRKSKEYFDERVRNMDSNLAYFTRHFGADDPQDIPTRQPRERRRSTSRSFADERRNKRMDSHAAKPNRPSRSPRRSRKDHGKENYVIYRPGDANDGGYDFYRPVEDYDRTDKVRKNQSSSKQYFFKERRTSPQPRNWMHADQEFMNERAFSQSIPEPSDAPNAYAINQENFQSSMFDRHMPNIGENESLPPPSRLRSPRTEGLY